MVAIRQMLVTGSKRRVNGGRNSIRGITIHETANTSRGANADAHGRYQRNGGDGTTSWQYTSDDVEVVQSYQDTDQCRHAGTATGNNTHIAVEICVNSDGDYEKAVQNAAELTAILMARHNLTIEQVKQHNAWWGKNCPANLRSGKAGGWSGFINRVLRASGHPTASPAPSTPPSTVGKSVSQLADEVLAGKYGNGNERKNELGDKFVEVQAEVNRRLSGGTIPVAKEPPSVPANIDQMARDAIAGKYGNGDRRKANLGSNYAAVQARINEILLGGAKPQAGKSIDQMAREIIAGKHGNGHDTRRANLGITPAQYSRVRARVNQLVS